ncbi:MAG: ABC transporter permease subunit [Ardenticatenaceae bacterium]|nr:ABC transporter permease subunit [Ardenticatenaceae bacterium]
MAKRGKKEQLSPGMSALRTVLIAVILFLVYAFAVQDTQINLEEPLDPRRQETTIRVLRALARPNLFTFNEEIRGMDINIRMPCGDEIIGSQVSLGDRTTTLSPNCVTTTQDVLTLRGEGFRPNTSGIIRWYPPGDVSTTRALSSFRTDGEGNFEIEFTMPDVRPTDEPQRIEVEEKWQTGISGLSEASQITLEKITETILLALLATTVGTILAIPISFIAARNLMENFGSPLAAVMSAIIALPIGYFVGRSITNLLINMATTELITNTFVQLVIAVILIIAVWAIVQFGVSRTADGEPETTRDRIVSILQFVLAAILSIFALAYLGQVGLVFGGWLESNLGFLGFIGGFLALASEFFLIGAPGIIGFLVGLVAMSYASRFGQEAVLGLPDGSSRILSVVVTGIGTAVLVFGIGSSLNWLYVFDNPQNWTIIPAIAGGVLGAVGTAFIAPKRLMPIGFITYTIVRGILNLIRSIEPLVYVIAFAVWVGIGPFAGVMALTLHTVAALGKLFSEQVENISEGPLEAITATGANAVQRVVFAVIPQIVPPYIAFTLYRWDINVRMSTIIGFGGGGGIGFVLSQAINLLRYRDAAVMMIAIAIVVGTLDYVSSRVRARIL